MGSKWFIGILGIFLFLVTILGATALDVNTCDLLKIGVNNNSAIVLISDIDCAGYSTWTVPNTFGGSITGNNHTISNLEHNNTAGNNGGLFSQVGGTFLMENFCLDNITLSGNIYVGILWAYDGSATFVEKVNQVCIKNSHFKAYGTNSATAVAPFFGYGDVATAGYINNSYSWNNTISSNVDSTNSDYCVIP